MRLSSDWLSSSGDYAIFLLYISSVFFCVVRQTTTPSTWPSSWTHRTVVSPMTSQRDELNLYFSPLPSFFYLFLCIMMFFAHKPIHHSHAKIIKLNRIFSPFWCASLMHVYGTHSVKARGCSTRARGNWNPRQLFKFQDNIPLNLQRVKREKKKSRSNFARVMQFVSHFDVFVVWPGRRWHGALLLV